MRLKAESIAVTAPEDDPLILQDFLPYRLSVVTEAVSSLFAAHYQERFGLSIPEWRVVAVVGQQGMLSTQKVIELTGMDRVRVSRAVIRLADKALLERQAHPSDQRAQILRLSPQGRAVYREIVPLAREIQAGLASALTMEEQRQLAGILEKIGRRTRELSGQAGTAAE